jgi:hypothetical protein
MRIRALGLNLNIAISILSTLLILLIAEIGYRIFLLHAALSTESDLNYRVIPHSYVAYDEKHGERFKPNSELWVTYVKNGEVVFGAVVSRSNSDGLGGKTTIKEYQGSRVKILVFGDSFSHWNQNHFSWPDLFQDSLSRSLGEKVAVLNYARGMYGVLQMLDLSADEVQEYRPDLAVIAFTYDDFTRDRWWSKEITWHGFHRWMISSNKEDFLDYRYAVDACLINPVATREWCMNILSRPQQNDSVLLETDKEFLTIKAEVEGFRHRINPFSFVESYLFRRVLYGTPYRFAPFSIPRVSFSDFSADKAAVKSCERLLSSGVSIRLVYLPTKQEIQDRKAYMSEQAETLMHSLEKMLQTKVIFLQNEIDHDDVGKIDLEPYDPHPNYEGLVLYSRTLTKVLLSSNHALRLEKSSAVHHIETREPGGR